MPLTRDCGDTIRARVSRGPKFRKELLREGVESMLSGDIATATTILRDYSNATLGCSGRRATPAPKISLRLSVSSSDARVRVACEGPALFRLNDPVLYDRSRRQRS